MASSKKTKQQKQKACGDPNVHESPLDAIDVSSALASNIAGGNPSIAQPPLTAASIPRFVVSMTTSPSRIADIRTTLDSIIAQTYCAERIVINIPEKYARTGEEYVIPGWFEEYSKVLTVNRIPSDLGPITKLAPTVKLVKPAGNVYIVTIDDDIRYLPHMLEDFARALVYHGHNGKALGYSGFFFFVNYDENVSLHFPVMTGCHMSVIEGYAGACYHQSFFGEDFDAYVDACIQDPDTRFSDDLVISNYLAMHGIKRYQLFTERVNRKLVWTSGCVLPLGLGEDALHTGAGGKIDGNNVRYVAACRFLKSLNFLALSNC